MTKDSVQLLKSVFVVLEHLSGVLDLIHCLLLKVLSIDEEPICVAGVLERRSRLLEDISSNICIIKAHLDEVFEPNDTLGIHSALCLEKLTQECICDSFDAGRLKLIVLIANQLKDLHTVLLLARLVVGLRNHLRHTKDPLHAL